MATPLATYRLQLQPSFGFDAAADLADYLHRLGVSHLYASPYLQAAPGSTHGYDVVDPTRVNDELGGTEGHERLCRALRDRGLGQILDIVPNHQWVGGTANPWWWDVLANGPKSAYADFYDIDWEAPIGVSPPRLLLPVLGQPLADALAAGRLELVVEAGPAADEGPELRVGYYEHRFPVAEGTVEAAGLGGSPGQSLEQLAESVSEDPMALEALLERQFYRLSHWRIASHEINYRRFFHINQLAGVRVEAPAVFEATHRLVLDWLADGTLDGLRIDHVDGLRDPTIYLERLRHEAPGDGPEAAAWVIVEKILEPGERLPEHWPIAGTTGYELVRHVLGLLVDPASEAAFSALYSELGDGPSSWADAVHDAKQLVVAGILAADVERLVELFAQTCQELGREEPWSWLRDALREALTAFPVYRTYVPTGGQPPRDDDLDVIDEAIDEARSRRRHLSELLDVLRRVLRLEIRTPAARELLMRFQQVTGPAMAKGAEDTAAYRYVRLAALNEVGGDPGHFGGSVDDFHDFNQAAARDWPARMLTLSTHDTKRSADVRARLALLSEIPDVWEGAVRRWIDANERHRGELGQPGPNTEYLLYQTLVGAWPIEVERVTAYMLKAVREAKHKTSWIDPDPDYERAVERFVQSVCRDVGFRRDLESFVDPLIEPGRINSLAQTLLELTSPGVPDIYQGDELWDLSLVDPDNRRPVDYELRRRLLGELEQGLCIATIWERADEALPKLWTIRQALHLRRRRPDRLGPGASYQPVSAEGAAAGHVVAYLRGGSVAAVVPRLILHLGGAFERWDWRDTAVELPEGDWVDVLSGAQHAGGRLALSELLARFPVALLDNAGVVPQSSD